MAAPVEIGQVLAGKYRVEKVLGAGGMGVVVAAWHLELEAMVALKFLLPEILDNQQAIDRFLREARAAVKLKSEHTCQVRDVGRLENGAPYIVMEYLEGSDLLEELRRRGPIPVNDVASYIAQACKAMTEAHAVGIVHRDLKPQNLFLTRRGDGTPLVKVLDFGIAKLRLADGSATQTAVVMGSPAYMAPEQARSAKHADLRADIYSLGVILYQLTTARLPFAALEKPTGELSLTEVLLAVQMDEATPLRAWHPALPPGWEDVVMRALAKDPNHRFQTAQQLMDALMPFANARITPMPFAAVAPPAGYQTGQPTSPEQPVHTVASVAPGSTTPMRNATNPSVPVHGSPTTLSGAVGTSIPPVEKKKKGWVIPAVAAAVVVVAGVTFAAVKGGGGGDDPTTTTTKPEPTKPEPTKPEPVKPEPSKPDPTAAAKPAPAEPAKPEPAKPEPTKPEPAQPEPIVAKPEPTKPTKPTKPTRPTKPTTVAKPEPTKPEPTKPEPTKPTPTKPEPTKPEPAKPDPKKPCRSDDVLCQFGNKSKS